MGQSLKFRLVRPPQAQCVERGGADRGTLASLRRCDQKIPRLLFAAIDPRYDPTSGVLNVRVDVTEGCSKDVPGFRGLGPPAEGLDGSRAVPGTVIGPSADGIGR